MAGYIGSKASVVSSGAERKKTFAITTTTTALTGLVYTPTKVHVFHNGVRLVDGTDFTATNSTSITLTVAAESGDQVVVVSYASFQTSDTVSASAGGTFAANVNITGTLTSDGLTLGANNANSPQILFENSDGVTGDAALSTFDDSSGTMLVMGSNFYINSSGSETRFNTSEESSAVMLNRNGELNLMTGGTGATATARLKIDSSGNVGIGTSSPDNSLEIDNSANYQLRLKGAGSSFAELGIDDNNRFRIFSNGAERMRIDSSGNLLVNGTVSNPAYSNTANQISLRGSVGTIEASRNGGAALELNRKSSDGTIIQLRKDGSTVGSIGANGNSGVYIAAPTSGGAALIFNDNAPILYPAKNNSGTIAVADNVIDLGASGVRFDDIYATNGTIQTSDRNEKQDVAALTATEMLVAARISGLFKTFRWIDSVADKGDDARTHTGVIAQDVHASFLAEGLDAGDYALFTSTTWWETQTDVPAVEADEDNEIEAADAYTRTDTFDTLDEAPDGATERTRMGIRYPELLAFVGSYNEQRFASIETRLAALEGN